MEDYVTITIYPRDYILWDWFIQKNNIQVKDVDHVSTFCDEYKIYTIETLEERPLDADIYIGAIRQIINEGCESLYVLFGGGALSHIERRNKEKVILDTWENECEVNNKLNDDLCFIDEYYEKDLFGEGISLVTYKQLHYDPIGVGGMNLVFFREYDFTPSKYCGQYDLHNEKFYLVDDIDITDKRKIQQYVYNHPEILGKSYKIKTYDDCDELLIEEYDDSEDEE